MLHTGLDVHILSPVPLEKGEAGWLFVYMRWGKTYEADVQDWKKMQICNYLNRDIS